MLQVRELKTENAMLEQRVLQYKQEQEAVEVSLRALRRKEAEFQSRLEEKDEEVRVLREREVATRRVMTESQKNQAEALVKDMQDRMDRENALRLELEDVEARLETAENERRLQESRLQETQGLVEELLAKLEDSAATIDRLNGSLDELRAERDDARAERDDYRRQLQVVKASNEEAASKIEEASTELRDREKDLAAARRELSEVRAGIEDGQKAGKDAEAARAELNTALRDGVSELTAAKRLQFIEGESPRLVILSDDLFQPGTVMLSDAGLEALGIVAKALAQAHWSELQIEGHTDNRPVKNMPFVDNWDLAAARASTVARWLASKPEIPAHLIAAASHAWYQPMGSNESADGRRKNRRVEIVVLP